MNLLGWVDRLLLIGGMAAFFTLCYLMFFSSIDAKKKTLQRNVNLERFDSRTTALKDMVIDLRNLSKQMQIKNAVASIQFDDNAGTQFMEKTFKIALMSEVIEIKTCMMLGEIKSMQEEILKANI